MIGRNVKWDGKDRDMKGRVLNTPIVNTSCPEEYIRP